MLETVRPEPIRSPALESLAGSRIRHGFFTRAGGVSQGIYDSLNVGLGSADAPDRVAQNRKRVAAWLGVGPDRLVTLHQVHSALAVSVAVPFGQKRPEGDALVTDRPGLALGVLTADCGPVLFADAAAGVIGAAHAGWKGALTGVLEATITAMEKLGAERSRIRAVLGPSIGPDNYEVGPEFSARFLAADAANEHWFHPSTRADHALFDLPGYTLARLRAAGVAASATGRCTYAEPRLFYSYRRATHRAEPDYGRQISAIVLEEH